MRAAYSRLYVTIDLSTIANSTKKIKILFPKSKIDCEFDTWVDFGREITAIYRLHGRLERLTRFYSELRKETSGSVKQK